MRLPRDVSGEALATLLRRAYGYTLLRQTGSHMRLVSTLKGHEHQVTVPRHRSVRVGTLDDILSDVAGYLEIDKDQVARELFER